MFVLLRIATLTQAQFVALTNSTALTAVVKPIKNWISVYDT